MLGNKLAALLLEDCLNGGAEGPEILVGEFLLQLTPLATSVLGDRFLK